MRVFAKRTLREFWQRHPDSEQQLKAWHQQAVKASWDSPNQLLEEFPNARQIGSDRVIFNIKGNQYRLIARINYKYSMLYIRFIGTHAEYDKINPYNV